MLEEAKKVLANLNVQMLAAVAHLEKELTKVRAGKATPQMLESVFVDYYGTNTALSQIANINTPDAKTLVVQPWEKNFLVPIEKAIMYANLGFNPQNDGQILRISVPPLTEERRKEMVKKCKAEAEASRITVRNLRRDAIEAIKKLEKKGLEQDTMKAMETEITKITGDYISKVDKTLATKEAELLKI